MIEKCASEKDALKNTLNERCASDADELVKELQDKHNKVLTQNIDSLTEQQQIAQKDLDTSLVRKCQKEKDELRTQIEDDNREKAADLVDMLN